MLGGMNTALKDIILPLIAVLWASSSTFISIQKELNTTRDKVLIGCIDDHKLTSEHRRLLLHSDWLPLATFEVLLFTGFGIFARKLPAFMSEAGRNRNISRLCNTVAFFLWTVAAFQLFDSFWEYLKMGRLL